MVFRRRELISVCIVDFFRITREELVCRLEPHRRIYDSGIGR